ncbi:hypothetical protein ACFFRR_000628 [Megaselia abdita]
MDKEKSAEEFYENLMTKGSKEIIVDTELNYPTWYDEALYKKGQKLGFKYAGVFYGLFMYGLQVILSIDTISKIFQCTKQSSTPKMAYKRYLTNGVHQSTWISGELKPGSEAWKSFEIVQNYHRRANRTCARFNAGFINQKDLALTQFALIGMFCTDGFIRKVDDQEFLDSTMHIWRVFGHFLGIKDEFNICAGTWEDCEPRFRLVMDRIIKPQLDNAHNNEYAVLVRPMIDGLRPMNLFWTYDSCLFINKWLAGCDNCQFFESDYKKGVQVKEKFSEYNKLGWYDKLYVTQMIWSIYLTRFTFFRIIINILFIIPNIMFMIFPAMAIWKYGYKWAYVGMKKPSVK